MRADLYLFKAGFSKSRESARKSIEQGLVKIDGKPVAKPASEIDITIFHKVEFIESCEFVGRGGLKLDFALKMFKVDATDCVCADIGASTGGFTDVLLRAGAEKVYAVDSGHGQLDSRLCDDDRVINLEGVNARYLSNAEIPELCDLVVMDVSFISQGLILPALSKILKDDGTLITLIKPQFEAGKNAVGKGGIVKKPADRFKSAIRVKEAAEAVGLYMCGLICSPVTGGDGNVEYLSKFTKKPTIFPIDKTLFN